MNAAFVVIISALIGAPSSLAQQRSYNTSKAVLEINDPKAQRNPVRSVVASNWKAMEARGRLKPKSGQDIAVVCEGKFAAGYIADDLYSQTGTFNRSFVVGKETTVMDLCNQMEDDMRQRNPGLFK